LLKKFDQIYLINNYNLTIFFDKNKGYSFIQIDRVHRYNIYPKSLKMEMINMRTNSQHPC